MEDRYSITVTWLPKELKMQANSRPITPPPIMARRDGTSFICSRLVLSTTPSNSRPGMGREAEVEPVASSICVALISCPETTTVF